MACTLPPRQCIDWHYKSHLAGAKDTGKGIRARCPVCGDRTLTISEGDARPIVWQCFRDCGMEDIRRALVDAGVPSRCLPPVSRTEKAMGAVAEAARESAHHPKQALLRVYLIALGYHWWPKDPLLTRLAAEVEVSRRTAYDAKGAGPLRPQGAQPASGKPPVPPVPITPETVLSSAAGQAAFNGQAQCDPSHSVRPTALAEVQPTALSAGHQSGGTAS